MPKTDTDIMSILRDVALLFDPTPSIINTNFSHQLRLTTDQPVHARMRQYSPEETRVLREHVKKLYEAGYARPLTLPYSANPLIVPKADYASNVGIRVLLHQRQADGFACPIAYASRKLLPAEVNYCASIKKFWL
ncbi:hypothetical protein BB561_006557 [Smittium simulii]|uniref:Reverse transcriptase RNase H-like domain-containing protein n=1 Tax=Smittium simulii TaxID=133385 RepID=A0A2T9Y365_9FUNG|nr:hypothetical protein BB561_006557 [Smittium simulii]